MKDLIKLIITTLIRIILLPLYLLPINSKRIVFMSYSGLQYSCNPKYISEFIEKNNYAQYELIWVFSEPEKFLLSKNIKKVRYLSFMYFYYVITSQFCISNTGFNRFFIIRNGQRFVQTWHGGGAYKRRSLNENKTKVQAILDAQHDNMITDFLSTSEYFTKYFIKDSVYSGRILNFGMPRNEYLVKNSSNDKVRALIKSKLNSFLNKNLDENFLVLYAPTWRDDGSLYEFPNFNNVLKAVENRFNKKPVLLLRSHHFQTLSKELNCSFYDVRQYDDMQELLLISDMLISDYSSSIWDYSLLYKPCFLYTPDLKHYEDMRGFYTPISSWGFDVCQTSSELQSAILNFNLDKYSQQISKMHQEFQSFENENSTSLLLNELGIKLNERT